MKPRSKHYVVMYHWFRVCLKPNNIMVLMESKQHLADSLTNAYRRGHSIVYGNYGNFEWDCDQVGTFEGVLTCN